MKLTEKLRECMVKFNHKGVANERRPSTPQMHTM